MILEHFVLGSFETNAYLVGCRETKRAAVIDAPEGIAKKIVKRTEELSLAIEAILLTHSHQDHIAGLFELKEACAAPVYVHPKDEPNLNKPGIDGIPLMLAVKAVEGVHFLREGEIFQVGNLCFEVLYTPGHTPGGVSFYAKEEKVLFSGDTLFHGAIGNLSFPTAQPALMWKSLKRLAALPFDVVVYPGHGEPTTIGREQWIVHAKERYQF